MNTTHTNSNSAKSTTPLWSLRGRNASFVSDEATPHTTISKKNTKVLVSFFLVAFLLFGTLFQTGVMQLQPAGRNIAYADSGMASDAGTTIDTFVRSDLTDRATGTTNYIKASNFPSYSEPDLNNESQEFIEPNHIKRMDTMGGTQYVRLDVSWSEPVGGSTARTITLRVPYNIGAITLGSDASTKAYTKGLPTISARANTPSGTKDNSRLITITLTTGAIEPVANFNIFFQLTHTISEIFIYDEDTADLTPHLNIGGVNDVAIGEALRFTIAARGTLYTGLQATTARTFSASNISEAAWLAKLPAYREPTTAQKAKLGTSYKIIPTVFNYGADALMAGTYCSKQVPKSYEYQIILPKEATVDWEMSKSGSYTFYYDVGVLGDGRKVIRVSPDAFNIKYLNYINNPIASNYSLIVKYNSPPEFGDSFVWDTSMSGIYVDGIPFSTSYTSRHIYDTTAPTSKLAVANVMRYQSQALFPGDPWITLSDNFYSQTVTKIYSGDCFWYRANYQNTGETDVRDPYYELTLDGDKIDFDKINIWYDVMGAINPGRLDNAFDNMTLFYSDGSQATYSFSDNSKFDSDLNLVNDGGGHNYVLTKDFVNWSREGIANNVFIKTIGIQTKNTILKAGKNLSVGIHVKLREYRHTGVQVKPTQAGFNPWDVITHSGLLSATPDVVGATMLTASATSGSTNIYPNPKPFAAPSHGARSGQPSTSIGGGNTISISTNNFNSSTNDPYNSMIRNPKMNFIIPEYLNFKPETLVVKKQVHGGSYIDTSFSAITHRYATAPGVVACNIYTITIPGDFYLWEYYMINTTFKIDVPLDIKDIDNAWFSTVPTSEDEFGNQLKPLGGNVFTDVFDLDGNGNTTEDIREYRSTFRTIRPSIFSTGFASSGDRSGGAWLSDALDFSNINNLNLAKVKDKGTIRYKLSNATADSKAGMVYIRLADGDFKPTLSGFTLVDVAEDGTRTTRSTIGAGFQPFKYTLEDPANIQDSVTWSNIPNAPAIPGDASEIPYEAKWLRISDLNVPANTTLEILSTYDIPKTAKYGDAARSYGYSMHTGNLQKANYAGLVVDTYQVHYDLNGATTPASISPLLAVAFSDSNFIPEIEPQKHGFAFKGWDVSVGGKATPAKNVQNSATYGGLAYGTTTDSITLKASFEAIEYKITYAGLQGANVATRPATYTLDTVGPIYISKPVKDHYTFLGWSVEYANPAYTDLIAEADWVENYIVPAGYTSDIKLTAHFGFTISYQLNGGSNPTWQALSYTNADTEFSTVSISQPNSRLGYTFKGWTATYKSSEYSNFNTTVPALNYAIPIGAQGDVELTASFETNSYKVAYANVPTAGLNNMTNKPSTYTVETNAAGRLVSNPTKAGYTFAGWTETSADASLNSAGNITYSIPTPAATNITLSAVWSADSYTVSYTGINASILANMDKKPSSYTLETNEAGRLVSNPTKAGYTFAGWTIAYANGQNSTTGSLGYSIPAPAYGNATLSAVWTANVYTVTYENADLSTMVNKPSTFTIETPATGRAVSNPTKAGYTFNSWQIIYEDGTATGYSVGLPWSIPANTTTNITMKASWGAKNYGIYYANVSTSSMTNKPISYSMETNATGRIISNPTKTGYVFAGWTTAYDNGLLNTTGAVSYSIPAAAYANVTLTAVWTANVYTITYAGLQGANVATRPATYTLDTVGPIYISKPVKDHYTFLGWSVEYANPAYTDLLAEADWVENYIVPAGYMSDIRLTAHFGFTINYQLNGYTQPTGQALSYRVEDTEFSTINIINPPARTGYTFKGWTATFKSSDYVSLSTTQPSLSYAIPVGAQGDVDLTASFEAIKYSITYIGINGTGVGAGTFPRSYTIETGLPLSIADPIRAGHTFKGWTVEYTDPTLTDLTDEADWAFGYAVPAGTLSNIKLTANWVPYVISYELEGGTNPDGQPTKYNDSDTASGTIAIANAIPRYGYEFSGWTVEFLRYGYDSQNITVPTKDYHIPQGMQSDIILTANYIQDTSVQFTLTYHGNDHTAGTAPVDTTVYLMDDEAVVLDKGDLAKTDYTFIGWSTVATAEAADFTTAATNATNATNGNGSVGARIAHPSTADDLVLYQAGDTLALTDDLTLYAIWSKNPPTPPTDPGNGGGGTGNNGTDPGTGGIGNNGNGTGNGSATLTPSNNGGNGSGNGNRTNGNNSSDNSGNSTNDGSKNGVGQNANITNPQTPLSSGNATDNWSLLSLLLAITSVLVSLMFMLIRRRKDDDDSTDTWARDGFIGAINNEGQGQTAPNGKIIKLVSVLLGILPIALFLILDDITAQMTFINKWTVFVAIAFVAHIVITLVAKVRQDKETENDYVG